jgi:hypothetical protein
MGSPPEGAFLTGRPSRPGGPSRAPAAARATDDAEGAVRLEHDRLDLIAVDEAGRPDRGRHLLLPNPLRAHRPAQHLAAEQEQPGLGLDGLAEPS